MLISKYPNFAALPRPAWARLCLFFLVAFASLAPARAQALDDIIYTVGTTTKDAALRDWGYIAWMPSTPGLVQGKHFAIYWKAGAADSLNPFTRQAVVTVQTEPAVIQVILNRSINLGDNLEELEKRIDNLFQKIMPSGSLTLAEKISIVIRGSLGDPNYFNNLTVLARLHPSVSMCLGLAHSALIEPGETTFEVREFDLANTRDLGVVGRVTVKSGVVIELPAPGPPVAVPENNAKGDLNVKLRWGTPDELRRLALLNYGFNLYRMNKTFAEANNFDATPPSPSALLSLAGNPNVLHLNRVPILKDRDYTLATAPNFALDPTNAFFADDNRRFEPGGIPLQNGDKFYYFVAARDVLGRNGKISPGTLVTICDKLPPESPNGVSVINDYHFDGGVSKQVLKVRWKQDPGLTDSVKAYYVYRWQNPDQVQALAFNPASHRIAGPIPHVPGQLWNSYVDDGAGSPAMPIDAGKTFWYTIRSEDMSACGGNLSPNSGPAFGVLRDRVGPDAPGGFVQVICRRPFVVSGRVDTVPDRTQDESLAYYTLNCNREDEGIAWADFYAIDVTTPSNYVGRAYFPPSQATATVHYTIARTSAAGREIQFFCRVGSTSGKISNYAVQSNPGTPKFTENRHVNFEARTVLEQVRPVPGRKSDCFRHEPTGPGGVDEPGSVSPVDVTITLTPGTKEFKLYRRIDFGPLTLIKQGPANFDDVASITIPDEAMPPNAGSICYYGQLFDEHGNASPLTLLGDDCIIVSGTTPLPAPMLTPLVITGAEASPKMTIKWFCPPYGVERFKLHIAVDTGIMLPSFAPELSDYLSATPDTETYTMDGQPHTNEFYTYRTPRVGPGFGNGATFEIEASVIQGKRYTVFITAVGKDDSDGPRSNVEDGIWSPAILVGPQVPWPARPLPAVNIFSAGLQAAQLPNDIFPGLGVQIGLVPVRTGSDQDKKETIIYSLANPLSYLHTNNLGEKLFPAAMYRVQVANTAFPQVSGDVVQVTPLMEQIAYSVDSSITIALKDPFIRLKPSTAGTVALPAQMYLIDTQPVVFGAKYIYLLVRFNDVHEIKEIVPSTFVEVLSP